MWSNRDKKKLRKTFGTLAEAKLWRADAITQLDRGTIRAPSTTTLNEGAAMWLKDARTGKAKTRSGHPYKPSAIRGYDAALRTRVLPEFGTCKLSELSRLDLQRFAERLEAGDPAATPPVPALNPSTVRNMLMPLRAIYRRALVHGEVVNNPTTGLQLAVSSGRRDRIADPAEAGKLIAALSAAARAMWATAFYAGLRRGELQALRWEDVDMASGIIRAEWSWDDKEGILIKPKSKAGRRSVPLVAALRDTLTEHKLTTSRDTGFVFGCDGVRPFTPNAAGSRADTAWKAAKLTRITLHECRHTYASLMIAAGVNMKALSTYMGHATISITLDRYGHLLPGNETEPAGRPAGWRRSWSAPTRRRDWHS